MAAFGRLWYYPLMKHKKKDERISVRISKRAYEVLRSRANSERRNLVDVVDMLCGV
jgi:uncharacterized protein (DUF1778 family)